MTARSAGPSPASAERPRPGRVEAEFLAGVLAVTEAPPPRLVLILPVIIFAMTVIAIAWSIWAEIEIVSSAEGRIVPLARVKVVQAPDTGIVRAIHVREGGRVEAGQPVIDLDPTETAAERDRLLRQIDTLTVEAMRLQALHAGGDPVAAFRPPAGSNPGLVATQRRLLDAQWQHLAGRIEAADREIARARAGRASTLAKLDKLRKIEPLIERRVTMRKELADKQLVPISTYLELEQTRIENREEMAVLRQTLLQADAEIALAEERWHQLQVEFRRDLLAEIGQKERDLAALGQDLLKAEKRATQQVLLSPATGTVQDLATYTIGAVVRQADPLMKIVPEDRRLEIEAMVRNKDIGFVRPGQRVEIKVETFPYTLYGTVPGDVVDISADTSAGNGATDQSRQIYKARIAIARPTIRVEAGDAPLLPGMAVTVDFKTGTRRIIEYVLAPVMRYRNESLRER